MRRPALSKAMAQGTVEADRFIFFLNLLRIAIVI